MMEEMHTPTALVENKPGVMQRMSGMFSRRGFNIDNITVGPTENVKYSRVTLAVNGDERLVEQVVKQLNKLISVIKVRDIDEKDSVCRELALVKVSTANSKSRAEITQYVEVFRGNIIDVATDSLIIEITGDPEKIDAFVELMEQYGIKEVARTGITAMCRGGKTVKDSIKY